jgi:hypothetical protein
MKSLNDGWETAEQAINPMMRECGEWEQDECECKGNRDRVMRWSDKHKMADAGLRKRAQNNGMQSECCSFEWQKQAQLCLILE